MRISTIILSTAALAITGLQSPGTLAGGSYGYGHHGYGGHHGGHHDNGYSYLLPGLILGYALSNNHHYSGNSYNYSGRDCRKVHKYRYDSYGSKTRISGTMCYDDYGNQYVVPGSRYVDNDYDSDYMD